MPAVGIIFELQYAGTIYGDSVFVVGGRSELGGWDVTADTCSAVKLHTNAYTYPAWIGLQPIWIEMSDEEVRSGEICVHYKYVIGETPPLTSERVPPKHLVWEMRIPNRRVHLPAIPGSVWLVPDPAWDALLPREPFCMSVREIHARSSGFVADGGVTLPTSEFLMSPGDSTTDQETALSTYEGEFDIEAEFEALSSAAAYSYKQPMVVSMCDPENDCDAEALEVGVAAIGVEALSCKQPIMMSMCDPDSDCDEDADDCWDSPEALSFDANFAHSRTMIMSMCDPDLDCEEVEECPESPQAAKQHYKRTMVISLCDSPGGCKGAPELMKTTRPPRECDESWHVDDYLNTPEHIKRQHILQRMDSADTEASWEDIAGSPQKHTRMSIVTSISESGSWGEEAEE